MRGVEYVIDLILDSTKYAIRDAMVFPGKNLKPVMLVSWAIALVSLLSALLSLPVLMNWMGSFCAAVFLSVLYFVTVKRSAAEIEQEADAPEELLKEYGTDKGSLEPEMQEDS